MEKDYNTTPVAVVEGKKKAVPSLDGLLEWADICEGEVRKAQSKLRDAEQELLEYCVKNQIYSALSVNRRVLRGKK